MASIIMLLVSCMLSAEIVFASALELSEDILAPLVTVDDIDSHGNLQLLQLHVKGPTSESSIGFHSLMGLASEDAMHQSESAVKSSHAASFDSFVETHGREYAPGTPEHSWRRKLFLQRASEADRHNSQPNRLWTAGVNKLADRSDDELKEILGWSGPAASGAEAVSEGMPPSLLQVSEVSSIHAWGHGISNSLPDDWSWGHLNATRRVHNQGRCGSCWAVASASVLQAHVEIHTPARARFLSVQELVSCVDNPHQCGGDGACDGATAELAMNYAMRYGLASVDDLAPEAVHPEDNAKASCPKLDESSAALLEGATDLQPQLAMSAAGVHPGASLLQGSRSLGIRAWERLPINSYDSLMHALVERGPAAVAVYASKWLSYSHGIFDSCQKDAVIDHAVTLIGYGHDRQAGEKYWQIQNSWGPEWGEQGRIRLLRRSSDETDYCGIDSQPEEGTGCAGGPKQVKVCGMCGILYDTVVPHF